MLATDTFSHTGVNGTSPHQRMVNAGYVFGAPAWGSGENIAIVGSSGSLNLTDSVVQMHENLFLSPGHRENILDPAFREVGTGVASGNFDFQGNSGVLNAVDVTENFAFSGTKRFVTGVCITDLDGDNFYDIGEGRGGMLIEVRRGGNLLEDSSSQSAGGYAVGLSAGVCEVRFSGAGLATAVNCTVDTSAGNVKVDLAGTVEILCSGDVTLGAGARHATLLGIAGIDAIGNSSANTLVGNRGANILSGLNGNDNLLGSAGSDRLLGGAGIDRLTGGVGRDVHTGGSERDIFDFNSLSESATGTSTRDRITDFVHGTDDLDLSTIDAIAGGINDAFKFIGQSAFNGTAGQLHYRRENPAGTANDKTIVEGDIDGDRGADFQIELTGLLTLSSSDFIL